MSLTVYCASKARHNEWWKALQAAGLPIIASWISWEGNTTDAKPTADMWSRHWEKCIEQAAAADICLFVSNGGETACGSLIEAGASLAAGKQVYVVSHDWFSFSHQLPSVPHIGGRCGCYHSASEGRLQFPWKCEGLRTQRVGACYP
jgi:hypothetical protein